MQTKVNEAKDIWELLTPLIPLFTILGSGIVAGFVSYVTARITLKNKLSEKWWDIKMEKYKCLIALLNSHHTEMQSLIALTESKTSLYDNAIKDTLIKVTSIGKETSEILHTCEFYFSNESVKIVDELIDFYKEKVDIIGAVKDPNKFVEKIVKICSIVVPQLKDTKDKLIKSSKKDLQLK